ncbi:MAG TPA: ThiF family adenylyltransferase [Symbiobacteriaceae bacterium]|nr:ThiF family adenylyltransferase [Symbiobacteriaceae bacterium]
MDNKAAVIIVGAGGIGSALFQDLCRFLPHTLDIHLVDGDTVEGKNIQRQMFSRKDLGRNKAEALQEKGTMALGLDRIYHHAWFLEGSHQLHQIAQHYSRVTLVGAVDNHPARRVMEAWVQQAADKRTVYYVDCANEESRGEVVAVFADKAGVQGAFRSQVDPAVLTDDRGDPLKKSCNQLLDEGNRQVLATNRKAAIIALECIDAHLKGETPVGIVYFRECQVPRLKGVAPGDGPTEVAAK